MSQTSQKKKVLKFSLYCLKYNEDQVRHYRLLTTLKLFVSWLKLTELKTPFIKTQLGLVCIFNSQTVSACVWTALERRDATHAKNIYT